MSILMITHDMGVVADIADEIIVMKAGKKILTGTPEELLQDLRGSVWKCVAYDKKEVDESKYVETEKKTNKTNKIRNQILSSVEIDEDEKK